MFELMYEMLCIISHAFIIVAGYVIIQQKENVYTVLNCIWIFEGSHNADTGPR